MKYGALAATAAFLLWLTPVQAQTPECEVEDWRAVPSFGGFLAIEGSATCESGIVGVRLYDGDTFIGTASGFITGHVLSAFATDLAYPVNAHTHYM